MYGYDPYNPDFWNWNWYEKRKLSDDEEIPDEEPDNQQNINE